MTRQRNPTGALGPEVRDEAVELLTRVVAHAVDSKLRDAVREVTSPPDRLRDPLLTALRFVGCNQRTTETHLRAALDEVLHPGQHFEHLTA